MFSAAITGAAITGMVIGGLAGHNGDGWCWDAAADGALMGASIALAIVSVVNITVGVVKFIKLKKAIAASKSAAMSRATMLQGLTGKKPAATSAAVDASTGNIFFGDSRTAIDVIHPALAKQMPSVSAKAWTVQNCAEFVAVNNALMSGAKMKNLVVSTVQIRKKSLMFMPMCPNCQISLALVMLVVSG